MPRGETSITCTAGVGTMIVEFGALTKLTGNPVFEETALRALVGGRTGSLSNVLMKYGQRCGRMMFIEQRLEVD